MRFQLLAALTFAVTAIASPTGAGSPRGDYDHGKDHGHGKGHGDVTVVEANRVCGNKNLNMQCCNEMNISGDSQTTAAGLLAGTLGNSLNGIGLFNGCSKISVTAALGLADLLDSKCKANVACCQGDTSQTGLINVGLPCIALSGLL